MSDWETRLTLLQRARDPSDESAWDDFCSYYDGFIHVVLGKMNVNPSDQDDLRQEILLRLWKVLPTYDKERAAFRTWMGKIIHGKVMDHYRATGRRMARETRVAADEPDVVTLPEVQAIMEAEWKRHIVDLALSRVSDHFTERAMTAFRLSMAGKTSAEIAEELDIKPNSVNKLKNRVKLRVLQEIERLREELEG